MILHISKVDLIYSILKELLWKMHIRLGCFIIKKFIKVMSMSLVSISVLIYIQNIMQDYLEIRDGEVKEAELE